MMNKEETQFLLDLVQSHKGAITMLRGFGKPTKGQQDRIEFLEEIIKKLNEHK